MLTLPSGFRLEIIASGEERLTISSSRICKLAARIGQNVEDDNDWHAFIEKVAMRLEEAIEDVARETVKK